MYVSHLHVSDLKQTINPRDKNKLTNARNNILENSFSSLDLDKSDSKTLLSNPQSYLSTLPAHEADRVREVLIPAYRQAFRAVFIIGASLSGLAFVLTYFLMPQVELSRPDDSRLKEEGRRAHDEKRNRNSA